MYCVNCGYEINGEGAFCDACGTQIKSAGRYIDGAISETPIDNPRGEMGEQAHTWASFISIAVVAILVLVGVYMGVNHIPLIPSHSSSSESAQYSEDNPEEDGAYSDEINSDDESQYTDDTEYTEETAPDEAEEVYYVGDSEFVVGGTYTVIADPNLFVRSEPEKNDDNILKKGDLVGDDYLQSVGDNDGATAGLKKGSTVECLEVSGNWMRIPSGWICIYDGKDQLVR